MNDTEPFDNTEPFGNTDHFDDAGQFDIDPRVVAEAAAAVDDLAAQVRRDGEAIAWAALEEGLRRYEQETGGSAEELLPDDESLLAFAGLERGREYARKVLCDRRDELRASVEAGIMGGSTALVMTLFAVLSLPLVALPIVISIASVLLVRGIDGYCDSAGDTDSAGDNDSAGST